MATRNPFSSTIFGVLCLTFGSNLSLSGQCTFTSAVADVTLNCSGGTGNRSGVAWYPTESLYYSVNAGSGTYFIECFAATGGAALATIQQIGDFRGFWYNPLLQQLEGNTVSSSGIYRHDINVSNGYPLGTASNVASANMPNGQSCGAFNAGTNEVLYYFNAAIHKYNRTTGVFSSSVAVTGLPSGNINSTSVGFTGISGSEVCLYDNANQQVHFVNYSTGAYLNSCQLPATAPTTATNYRMAYANNRIFLYDSGTSRWLGYRISAQADLMFSGNNIFCQPATNTTISASGAVSYLWSTGSNASFITVSPTTNTTFILYTTSQAGCTAATNFVLTVAQSPTLNAVASPSFQCDATTNTLSVSGADSYTWSVNATVASSIQVAGSGLTTYSVLGSNSFCTSMATVVVINDVSPAVNLTASSLSVCSGSSATLTAQGAASYSWTAGPGSSSVYVVTPTATTGYTVTGFSQYGCSAPFYSEDTLSVKVIPVPAATASASSNNICLGESLSLTGSGGINYLWMPGNLSPQTISVAPSSTTVYTLTVGNGSCSAMAMVSVSVNACTGVSEITSGNPRLELWPNPAQGNFHIKTNNAAELRIVNAQGQLIQSVSTDASGQYTVRVGQLPAGLYFVTGGGTTQKIVVE